MVIASTARALRKDWSIDPESESPVMEKNFMLKKAMKATVMI
ncbi:MAG: hypothetical protein AAB519_01750 [Patescibacteria group bacterium]